MSGATSGAVVVYRCRDGTSTAHRPLDGTTTRLACQPTESGQLATEPDVDRLCGSPACFGEGGGA